MAYNRKAQLLIIEDRKHYENHREAYLRSWAKDVITSSGNGHNREWITMPVEEIQDWYNETRSE